MAEVRTINVYTNGPKLLTITARQTVIWVYLICAEAVSHLWFGGSWVIDLIVLVGLVMVATNSVMRQTGYSAEMTSAELRLWVAAGTPLDVKEWQAQRKLHEVA